MQIYTIQLILDAFCCRGRQGLRRLEAAKIFFGAFALRTQAYNFHHAVGLTLFDTTVEQRMALTKISDLFEVILLVMGSLSHDS